MNDVDSFGLPAGVLGRHPEQFFAAIGRVVCVSAVLEEKITVLRHTLAGAPQGRFTQEPMSKQIHAATSLAGALPDPDAERVRMFLRESEHAFIRRNGLVHSSFPAQPDGSLWGHRPTRDKSVTDGRSDTVETSIEELTEFIAELAELVQSFNLVHAAAANRRLHDA